jgi:hypothetical protein
MLPHFLFAPQNCSLTSSLKFCANLCNCVPPGAANWSTIYSMLDPAQVPTVNIRPSHLRWVFTMSGLMNFFVYTSHCSKKRRTSEKLKTTCLAIIRVAVEFRVKVLLSSTKPRWICQYSRKFHATGERQYLKQTDKHPPPPRSKQCSCSKYLSISMMEVGWRGVDGNDV